MLVKFCVELSVHRVTQRNNTTTYFGASCVFAQTSSQTIECAAPRVVCIPTLQSWRIFPASMRALSGNNGDFPRPEMETAMVERSHDSDILNQ